ncbi:MAG: hypothetical protein HRT46_11705 [Deltaproteobacteria bacterium]|nr:hypothetical protein [Deltaproteobacteria bacterium]
MKPSRFSSIAFSLGVAALALGAAACLSTFGLLWESWWAGPAIDSWHFVNVLEAWDSGTDVWRRLAKNHGGHRPFFPRLLLLADYNVFGGRNGFVIVCSVVLQLGTWAALVGSAWVERSRVGDSTVPFTAGLALALCFCATQIENFSRAWNVHWFVVSAALAWSLAALSAAGAARTHRAVFANTALAVLLAGVATFSMSNGLLAWPCLLVGALWLRLRRAVVVSLLVTGALAAGGFLAGYMPGPALDRSDPWMDPLSRVLWVARCFGAPLSWQHPVAGTWLGTVGLLAFAAAAGHAARRRPRPADVVCLGVVAYCVGTAFLMAWGRMPYSEQSWSAPRYQTVSLLFWASLIVWLVLRVERRLPALVLRAGLLAGVAGLLVPAHFAAGERGRAFADEVRAAHLALIVGVSERGAYQATLPFSDRKRRRDAVRRHAGFLRARQLGMFRDARHERMGQGFDRLHPQRSEACEGGIFSSTPSFLGHWVRVEGWVRDFGTGRVPELIFVGPAGSVIGLGEPQRRMLPGFEDDERRFVAWRRASPSGEVWAVLADGSACRVAVWGRGEQPGELSERS